MTWVPCQVEYTFLGNIFLQLSNMEVHASHDIHYSIFESFFANESFFKNIAAIIWKVIVSHHCLFKNSSWMLMMYLGT